VAICVDNREAASRIVDLVHADFPGTKLYVRSFDRRHSLQLIAKGVDLEVRETYESALVLGRKTLEGLGLDPDRAAEIEALVRRRDLDRLALQQAEGVAAGLDLLRKQMVQEPLSRPTRKGQPLNAETQDIVAHRQERSNAAARSEEDARPQSPAAEAPRPPHASSFNNRA